jgi:aryl-alcohol dehydrogenase-like predicted oxidoreductase
VEAFHLSLERLRQPSVYALLVHHAQDLLTGDGRRFMNALAGLKARGLVQKVGVSVYDSHEVAGVLARHAIDIVQLPLNILDQRMLESGTLARLKAAGIEVHARSVFLQGLLLMDPDRPSACFRAVQERLRRLRHFASMHGLTPLEAALHFVVDRDEIDCAVIGVARQGQLAEIVAACRSTVAPEDYSGFALHDEEIINPARWPR